MRQAVALLRDSPAHIQAEDAAAALTAIKGILQVRGEWGAATTTTRQCNAPSSQPAKPAAPDIAQRSLPHPPGHNPPPPAPAPNTAPGPHPLQDCVKALKLPSLLGMGSRQFMPFAAALLPHLDSAGLHLDMLLADCQEATAAAAAYAGAGSQDGPGGDEEGQAGGEQAVQSEGPA